MIRIGVLCPSEIAFRRFMPALMMLKNDVKYVGLAVPNAKERFSTMPDRTTVSKVLLTERTKAQPFLEQYGGKLFPSYDSIISSDEIDAIYVPLPPALHFEWAKKALEKGKHVLVEKPSTTSESDSLELIKIASENRLAIHENYMFIFHNQLSAIRDYINSGAIGDVRLYRVSFGFPKRPMGDFRYSRALGGGSLIDAGGYVLKYARMLLGDSARILYSKLNYTNEYDVDLYGSGALGNDSGDVVQISFGMDNDYKCELEVWGSTGSLTSGRILTAPVGFIPTMSIKKGTEVCEIKLPSDDTFKKSICYFIQCIQNREKREESYNRIIKQAKLVNEFITKAE